MCRQKSIVNTPDTAQGHQVHFRPSTRAERRGRATSPVRGVFWDERSSQSGRKMGFRGGHWGRILVPISVLILGSPGEPKLGSPGGLQVRKMYWGPISVPILGSPGEPKMSTEIGTKILPRRPLRSTFSEHSARAARAPKKHAGLGWLLRLSVPPVCLCESWACLVYVVSKDTAYHLFLATKMTKLPTSPAKVPAEKRSFRCLEI